MLEKAEFTEPAANASWGVVIGADTSLEGANNEIQIDKGYGFENIKIYFRQNYYRSVILFSSKGDAAGGIDEMKLRDRFGKGLV